MPPENLGRLPAYQATDETEVIEAELLPVEPDADRGVIEVEPERHRSSIPGMVALLLALATPVLAGIAVGAATAGDVSGGTTLGWIAIWMSVAAVLLGLFAVLARFGGAWGVVAVLLGVLANPWLQLQVLRWLGGE